MPWNTTKRVGPPVSEQASCRRATGEGGAQCELEARTPSRTTSVRSSPAARRSTSATCAPLAESAREGGKYVEEKKVRALASDKVIHVRGRVIALRSTGGLSFLPLRDTTGEIQLLVSEAKLGADYARLADFDVGDIIEAEGPLTASKRGELSVKVQRVRLLTKAYRPLPENWHGLTDVELRYRQRYVDLDRQPKGRGERIPRARSHQSSGPLARFSTNRGSSRSRPRRCTRSSAARQRNRF